MSVTTVRVSNVSFGASQQDIKEFFSFSGDIEFVEMRSEDELSQVAYVMFKDPQGAETAVLLSGATIVGQSITVALDPEYQLPPTASVLPTATEIKNVAGAGSAIQKAEDVVSSMLAMGFILGKDAVNKAKAFDDKHQFTSTASAKVASLDQKQKPIFYHPLSPKPPQTFSETLITSTPKIAPIMATNSPNLECRMYEAKYPEVDMAVMIQVKSMADSGAYVSLLEYNNIEGMILFSELSRRRIRSISSLIKVGRIEPVMVLRVDKEKGYIDLSKRRVSEEDISACEERYNKSKLVHSIMRHVAETMGIDLEDLYIHVGWPLYRKYGHAFEAFKLVVSDPDSILNSLTREVKEIGSDGKEVTKVAPALSEEVKDALVKNIRRRMTPQPLKIRADIEMKCFQFDGVLHIKEAMRKAEAAGNDDCPVKIKLVAPPAYVLNTQTLDKEQGIAILTKAIAACTEEIERHKGKLAVKEAPRAVSEREDKLLAEQMAKLGRENEEISGDEDSEEEEDTGMGEIDVDSGAGIRE